MKNTILTLSVLFVILFTSCVYAQNDDFTNAILKAKKNLTTTMNNFDEKDLLKCRGEFERILQLKTNEWIVNYYLAYIDYSVSTAAMGSNDVDKVKKYTLSAFTLIDKSIEQKDDFADSYVLRMSLNFNRWMYESDKMEDIMSSTKDADAAAVKLDDANPRYYLMKGISLFYTPENFGGGIEPSLKLLDKSYNIFLTRKEAVDYYPDWGYDLACGYIAMAFMKRDKEGDLDKAKTYIDKGLEKNPESGFLLNTVKKQYDEKTKKN